ncbi:MAG: sigma-70 family RNA polymerase sigma factor, partial [bacterium]|nr:sigma-70 family RNA polymerase sigma factor [bacterium]
RDLADEARSTIRRKARQLIGKYGFTRTDCEDLQQGMTLDLLERLPKFDPNKAAHSTFVARVIERKISDLIRYRMQEKRDYRREACSVNESVEDGNGGKVERAQTISQDQQDPRTGKCRRPKAERIDMRLDVSFVISELPAELRLLAERLMAHSIAEVARELGVPRYVIYASGIARLREVFEDKGLQEYL